MSGPVIVAGVRPANHFRDAAEMVEQPKPLPREPQRGENWPFPSSDPAVRDAMARDHQAQQRAAVVGGEGAPL